jgi:hypothetical protein
VSTPEVGQAVHLEDFEHPMMVKSVDLTRRTVELICMTGTPLMIEVSFEELRREKLKVNPPLGGNIAT